MENLLIFIVVGLIAGFLASRIVTGKGKGWLMDIVIGILGSVIGGWLAQLLHISLGIGGTLGQFVIAFAGAVVLLVVWGAITGRGRKK